MAAEPLPAGLVAEAECMLTALRRELAAERVLLLRDARLPLTCCGTNETVIPVASEAEFAAAWVQGLDAADYVWPLAPETGGILADLSRRIQVAGKVLLGSRPDAVRLCGDKYATFRRLREQSIACVPTRRHDEVDAGLPPPWVVKPADGVGCEGVRLVTGKDDLGPGLVQPYLQGKHLSLSAVFAAGKGVCLSVNRQRIGIEAGFFHLRGCEVNVLPVSEWQDPVARIAAAVPGLWGYAGVDLIVTAEGPVVVEINPRLTLSYAGLGEALGETVAPKVLALARGQTDIDDIARWRRRLGRGRPVEVRT
ncbi:tyramine---L-glutamate ligase [Methylomarinovum tepidoasis]|uniref:Tyramine---L-glutamate ligase n=2 Tax=Methylomarinovum tepidoasis TaxID=2840183 RepID=A0AAU9C0N7_9GAMM|nr:tyramine---L-glutamate ligase [Methylomarinovum sp. IN45]